MFAKVGIIQQSAKHNLKKNFGGETKLPCPTPVGIGISATKRKNEGVSLALKKYTLSPITDYRLQFYFCMGG